MYDIEIKDLSVYYEKVCALKNINLNIKSKQFLGVIGPNGGGKTTLLKVILGLIKPSEGSVKVNKSMSIGYVPQFTSFDKQFPISVLEVVLMGKLSSKLKLFHKYTKEDIDKAHKVMTRLGISNLADRQIGGLSGGQMQKVLIARAIINDPKIIILDEPTASIDVNTKIEIYKILEELNKDITIIIVSHDVEDIIAYVDSIVCLNKNLHYHEINNKINKRVFDKDSCPVKLYLDKECSSTHCEHCGGALNV